MSATTTSGGTGRVDVWLSQPEEEELYRQISPLAEDVSHALARNDKWTAFTIVHRRYNPTIPVWFEGPVEHLESRLREKFTKFQPGPLSKRIERAQEAALGMARHIASMALFTAESSAPAMSVEALQKTGTMFFTRVAPAAPANALTYFKGNNVLQRMDAVLCTETLAMLCAVIGYEPSDAQVIPLYHYRFQPYYKDEFMERAPDRRSCAQLAAASRDFREYAFDSLPGRIFKPISENPIVPVTSKSSIANSGPSSSSRSRSRKINSTSRKQPPPSNEPDPAGDESPYFSIQSLQELAGEHGGLEKHPATMTLSWFAGRVKEFATMENNDAVRPVGELVRRATHVALMSPLLIFLATPFDDLNRPYGPGIFTMLSFGCVPFCVNGSLDRPVLSFRKLFMEIAVDLSMQPETNDAQKAEKYWQAVFAKLNRAAYALYKTEQPKLPMLLTDLIVMESDQDSNKGLPSELEPPAIPANVAPTQDAASFRNEPPPNQPSNKMQHVGADSAAGPGQAAPSALAASETPTVPRADVSATAKTVLPGQVSTTSPAAVDQSPPDAGTVGITVNDTQETSAVPLRQDSPKAPSEHPMIPLLDFAAPLPVSCNPPRADSAQSAPDDTVKPSPDPDSSTFSAIARGSSSAPAASTTAALKEPRSCKPTDGLLVQDSTPTLPPQRLSSSMKTRAQRREESSSNESDSSLTDISGGGCSEADDKAGDANVDELESEDEVVIDLRPKVHFIEPDQRRALRSKEQPASTPPVKKGPRKPAALLAERQSSRKQRAHLRPATTSRTPQKKQGALAPAQVLGKRAGDELQAPKHRQPQHGKDPIMDPVIALLQDISIQTTRPRKSKAPKAKEVVQQPEIASQRPNVRQRHSAALPFYRCDAEARHFVKGAVEFNFPYAGKEHLQEFQQMEEYGEDGKNANAQALTVMLASDFLRLPDEERQALMKGVVLLKHLGESPPVASQMLESSSSFNAKGSRGHVGETATDKPVLNNGMDIDSAPRTGPIASHEDAMDVDASAESQPVDVGGPITGKNHTGADKMISVSDNEPDVSHDIPGPYAAAHGPYGELRMDMASLFRLANKGTMLNDECINFGVMHSHHLIWTSNRAAADRILVLSTVGGLRGQIRDWARNEPQATGPPTTRAGAARQKVQQTKKTATKSEQKMAACRTKLNKAIDRHDFANAERIIFPIFMDAHFSLAVIANPMAWAAEGASFGETRVYHLCSKGWKLPKEARKEILQLLAQVQRRLKGEGGNPHDVHPVPLDADLEAIAQNIAFKELTVPRQTDDVSCGFHLVSNACIAMRPGFMFDSLETLSESDSPFKYSENFSAVLLNWAVTTMPDKALWKLNPEYQHSIPERFEELRGLYASRCLEAVGLIPDVIVECQDLEAPLEHDTTARVKMTLADMALEAANVNKSRCLNALSIPLLSTTGKVEGLSELHESFCDSHHAEVACVTSGADPLRNAQQNGRSFAIVSASGTIHPPHLDPNGMATFLFIHEGLKYIVTGVHEGSIKSDLPNSRKEGLWSLLKMPGLKIAAFVAGRRDAVLLPAGAAHAVAAVESVGSVPGPAIMLGGFGLRRSSMEDHLIHGIRFAVWHDDWSNDQHDDVVVAVARMLKWQLLFQHQPPFHGRALYALIMMGSLNLLLDGLPYDQTGAFTKMPETSDWRRGAGNIASDLANQVHDSLSVVQKKEFEAFQQEYIAMYTSQIQTRHKRAMLL